MGKKHIQGGKEMNIDVGKEANTPWKGNAYKHRILHFLKIS